MHECMVEQLYRCVVVRGGEFTFGFVLCAFIFERVVLLRPQVILDPSWDVRS
jgi:hypothetical protein